MQCRARGIGDCPAQFLKYSGRGRVRGLRAGLGLWMRGYSFCVLPRRGRESSWRIGAIRAWAQRSPAVAVTVTMDPIGRRSEGVSAVESQSIGSSLEVTQTIPPSMPCFRRVLRMIRASGLPLDDAMSVISSCSGCVRLAAPRQLTTRSPRFTHCESNSSFAARSSMASRTPVHAFISR